MNVFLRFTHAYMFSPVGVCLNVSACLFACMYVSVYLSKCVMQRNVCMYRRRYVYLQACSDMTSDVM